MKKKLLSLCLAVSLSSAAFAADVVFEAGHKSLKGWLLPAVSAPEGNKMNADRIELGKALFFDPRLSGDRNMSCATCHNPSLGWSDALPTAKGVKSSVLGRASPTVLNTAHNSIQMWDGRKKDLEDQATGPLEASVEMNADVPAMVAWLNQNEGYQALFTKAYPGEGINAVTVAKAIATFERTAISDNSPFDKWVKGDKKAMTASQVEGFKLFVGKAKCSTCHSGPNFTDNGFHNLGLSSDGTSDRDVGRFSQKKIPALNGAFKTPTVRDAARTAPYFHDGSAQTLMDVVDHYNKGGEVKDHLSPNVQTLNLNQTEKEQLVAFMKALTAPVVKVTLPDLPLGTR